MAGGIGSRFWPMSRSTFPKQFHDVLGTGKTLIQQTFDRFAGYIPKENIYIVTNVKYYDLVKEQLTLDGTIIDDNQILLEPVGKNTAPCVAYASYKIREKDPEAILIVASSDHLIQKPEKFEEDIKLSLKVCEEQEIIMLLGIKPTHPNTGYGYIQYLQNTEKSGYYKVKTFTEKPNKELAERFFASGDFVWNSGIFVFSVKTITQSIEKYLPDMAEAFAEIGDLYYSDAEKDKINYIYHTCQSISVDVGIMEKSDNVYVIPTEFGWSDLGTWGSVYENSDKDYYQNAVKGRIIMYNSWNNVVNIGKKEKLVVIKGLENFIIVDTEDTLLICPKDDEQAIKEIVNDVKAEIWGENHI